MIAGIDVSHHQAPGSIDWPAAKAQGYDFAYVRVLYGTKVDVSASEHIKAAQGAGLLVGAYQFFRQGTLALRHVQALEDFLGDYELDLPVAIDVESNTRYDGAPHEGYGEQLRLMCEVLSWNKKIVVYTTQAFWSGIGNPSWLRDPNILLWVAHWNVQRPALPAWKIGDEMHEKPWAIWQHRVAKVAFTGGPVDLNIARGIDNEGNFRLEP